MTPCPDCGKPPELKVHNIPKHGETPGRYFKLACWKCLRMKAGVWGPLGSGKTEEQARDAWELSQGRGYAVRLS